MNAATRAALTRLSTARNPDDCVSVPKRGTRLVIQLLESGGWPTHKPISGNPIHMRSLRVNGDSRVPRATSAGSAPHSKPNAALWKQRMHPMLVGWLMRISISDISSGHDFPCSFCPGRVSEHGPKCVALDKRFQSFLSLSNIAYAIRATTINSGTARVNCMCQIWSWSSLCGCHLL